MPFKSRIFAVFWLIQFNEKMSSNKTLFSHANMLILLDFCPAVKQVWRMSSVNRLSKQAVSMPTHFKSLIKSAFCTVRIRSKRVLFNSILSYIFTRAITRDQNFWLSFNYLESFDKPPKFFKTLKRSKTVVFLLFSEFDSKNGHVESPSGFPISNF